MKLAPPLPLLGVQSLVEGAMATRPVPDLPTREQVFDAVFHAMTQPEGAVKDSKKALPGEQNKQREGSESESAQVSPSEVEKADPVAPELMTAPEVPRPSLPNRLTKDAMPIRAGQPKQQTDVASLTQATLSVFPAPGLTAVGSTLGSTIEQPAQPSDLQSNPMAGAKHPPFQLSEADGKSHSFPLNAIKMEPGPPRAGPMDSNPTSVGSNKGLFETLSQDRLGARPPPILDQSSASKFVLPIVDQSPGVALPGTIASVQEPHAATMMRAGDHGLPVPRPFSDGVGDGAKDQARIGLADMAKPTSNSLEAPTDRVEPDAFKSLPPQSPSNSAIANSSKDKGNSPGVEKLVMSQVAAKDTAGRLAEPLKHSAVSATFSDHAVSQPDVAAPSSSRAPASPDLSFDPQLRDTAESAALSDHVSSRAVGTTAILPAPKPAILPQIAPHLADLALARTDQIEITLSPDELGPVRLSATQTEQGVVLLVQAERPETLDLMRRHISGLLNDLQDMGFADITYSDQQRDQQAPESKTDTEINHSIQAESAGTSGHSSAIGGLDIRL